MSRTMSEIQKSMVDTIATTDASIEVSYGPILDAYITPVATELESSEATADKLSQFYSTSFLKTATEDEVDVYITNFALREGAGKKATGEVVFATYTRLGAGEVLDIPAGVIVANSDATKTYITTVDAQILGDDISTYYNSTNSWYEVLVQVEATNEGTDFNLPALRIRQLLTPITGITVVTNRTFIQGGLDVESKERKFERVENAFLGSDKGSIAGLKTKVEDYNAAVESVAVVRSNERKLFTRFTNSLGLDVYVNGKISTLIQNEDHLIASPIYGVVLKQQPVTSIVSVFVDSVQVTNYVLEKDTTSLSGSIKGKDTLYFDALLNPGSVVSVNYYTNSLIPSIQTDLFSESEDALFNIDILAKEMPKIDIAITAFLTFSSSANQDTVKENVLNQLLATLNNNIPGYVFQPEIIRQNLIAAISGLTDIVFSRFTLASSSVIVETITLEKNQLASLVTTNVLLKG